MKKKKLLKSASLVALSAVMMCGAAAAFAGCGGNSANTISVSMFCSEVDSAMNRTNCENWAKEYTQKLRESGEFTEDREIEIKFSYQPNTETYFTGLANLVASNSQPDVFYVSPKYVKTWSNANKILDLAPSLAADAANVTGEKGIWEDSLAFYGYSKDEKYTPGDRIEFKDGKFVTIADGVEVGIYGLPKDYSNFGLGFNEVFFTPEVRKALTTKKTTDRTGVPGAQYNGAKLAYNGESGVVTSDGNSDNVPLVNIGVPTYYKPYNFYSFASYDAAVAGGDPMANAVEKFTGGEGYCVTIPGWPGDTFADAAADTETANNPWKGADTTIPDEYVDKSATYDTTQGFITYTYAEYSALTWAITYYVNTYDWLGNGKGGAPTASGEIKNVYGNDQYDGVLYLLPWLAGNDAQYLDEKSSTALNGSDPTSIGTATYTTSKRTLNGKNEDVEIQYGVNSQKFIDTVGAFHAYGSDWNGNSNNAGDTVETKQSGWDLFVAGNCVFYGVGTWNAGDLNATDRSVLKYRLMPEPVSEDFALYSSIKDADYQMQEYGTYKSSFGWEEIKENQISRQDQWGARMDSVGYGVSSLVADQGWKKDAAIDLVKYLTITPETQVSLTYSGAQLPNFKYQCQDYYKKTGDFEKMVTPEDEAFDATYQVAKDMYAASQKAETRSMTVEAWLQANHPEYVTEGKYYTLYKDTVLSTFANLNHAMRTLFLVAYTKADRDLSLRMQYGLNATRDSAMYTFTDAWIKVLDPRGSGAVMAYDAQTARSNMGDILDSLLYAKDAKDTGKMPSAGKSYGTPAWWCLHSATEVQTQLQKTIQEEKDLLG